MRGTRYGYQLDTGVNLPETPPLENQKRVGLMKSRGVWKQGQLSGHKRKLCLQMLSETWTQSICQASAADLGKESKGRKVCRAVLRDKDGSTGEMLPSKEQGTAKKAVKETAKEKRRGRSYRLQERRGRPMLHGE